MDFEQCHQYLNQKPEAELCFPFDPNVPVYKVKGKMFALLIPKGNLSKQGLPQVNLKCDPIHAQELRDVFNAIKPGYHMNKKHWNTLILDGSLPASEIERLIDHSYALVASNLPKTIKSQLTMHYPDSELFKGLSPYAQTD